MRRARAFKPRYALLAEPPFSAADPCRRIGRFRDSPARSVRFSSFRDVVSAHSCPAIPARERLRRDRERSDSLGRFCIAEFANFIGGRESGFSRFVFSRWGLRCLSIVKAVGGRSAPPLGGARAPAALYRIWQWGFALARGYCRETAAARDSRTRRNDLRGRSAALYMAASI